MCMRKFLLFCRLDGDQWVDGLSVFHHGKMKMRHKRDFALCSLPHCADDGAGLHFLPFFDRDLVAEICVNGLNAAAVLDNDFLPQHTVYFDVQHRAVRTGFDWCTFVGGNVHAVAYPPVVHCLVINRRVGAVGGDYVAGDRHRVIRGRGCGRRRG